MKASELRIGNLIYNSYTKDIFSVYPMFIVQFSKTEDTNIKPIQLTEEWLLKFGFIKYPDCRDTFQQVYYDSYQFEIDRFTIISFSIQQGNKNLIKCNFDRGYRSDDGKKNYYIKHVHQLQNLYFALTNEELKLTIKLTK
jgi:hypothetical protein